MFHNLITVDVGLLNFHITGQLIEDVFNLLLIDSFDRLTHQFASVAIGNGLVVIISMDVVAEHSPRFAFLF